MSAAHIRCKCRRVQHDAQGSGTRDLSGVVIFKRSAFRFIQLLWVAVSVLVSGHVGIGGCSIDALRLILVLVLVSVVRSAV